MKTIRAFLSVVLLSGIAVSQLPSLAQCSMMFATQTIGCHMTCCKKMPMKPVSRCADLKTQAPQDVLTATSQNPDFSVTKVVANVKTETRLTLKAFRDRFSEITQHLRTLILVPDIAGRAPPEDIHLQFA